MSPSLPAGGAAAVLLAGLLAAGAAGCGGDAGRDEDLGETGPAAPSAATLLAVPPLLGRPTADSVTLNAVAGKRPVAVEVTLEPPGDRRYRLALGAGEAGDLRLDALAAGTEYRYALAARAGADEERHRGRFVTRREPGAAFRFGVLSDPHLPVAPAEWLDPAALPVDPAAVRGFLADRAPVAATIARVARALAAERLDFVVCLGDRLHPYDGWNAPFATAEAARHAYLSLRAHLDPLPAQAPYFAVIGNWDGENGWHPEPLRRHGRDARRELLLNPGADTYPEGGGVHEDYFAWTWSDALFVALNVMSYTPTPHTLTEGEAGTAEDWTLGAEQLGWLEDVLRRSRERWKILLIHHPAGGRGGDALNSAYGRGGGRAAQVGEQARIHALMREHGVQILFYGHDHVFTDLLVDGIHYTLPGSAGAPWKFGADETGYDDYDPRSGFATVRVERERLEVELRDSGGAVFDSFAVAAERASALESAPSVPAAGPTSSPPTLENER